MRLEASNRLFPKSHGFLGGSGLLLVFDLFSFDHRASFLPRQGVSPGLSHLVPVMARQPGTKNKTRIEMTLSSWYGDKLKELRVDSGFDSDQAFSAWLLKNTVQILCGQREPTNQKLGDLRLRMEQALPAPEVINE